MGMEKNTGYREEETNFVCPYKEERAKPVDVEATNQSPIERIGDDDIEWKSGGGDGEGESRHTSSVEISIERKQVGT